MTKKGLSIGQSLRGRMANLTPEDSETDSPATELEATKAPAAKERLVQQTPVEIGSAKPSDPLESFNTRLRQSTHRKLKIYSATNNIKIQDIVNEAILSYIESNQE